MTKLTVNEMCGEVWEFIKVGGATTTEKLTAEVRVRYPERDDIKKLSSNVSAFLANLVRRGKATRSGPPRKRVYTKTEARPAKPPKPPEQPEARSTSDNVPYHELGKAIVRELVGQRQEVEKLHHDLRAERDKLQDVTAKYNTVCRELQDLIERHAKLEELYRRERELRNKGQEGVPMSVLVKNGDRRTKDWMG
jgi:hypothetical protein